MYAWKVASFFFKSDTICGLSLAVIEECSHSCLGCDVWFDGCLFLEKMVNRFHKLPVKHLGAFSVTHALYSRFDITHFCGEMRLTLT